MPLALATFSDRVFWVLCGCASFLIPHRRESANARHLGKILQCMSHAGLANLLIDVLLVGVQNHTLVGFVLVG